MRRLLDGRMVPRFFIILLLRRGRGLALSAVLVRIRRGDGIALVGARGAMLTSVLKMLRHGDIAQLLLLSGGEGVHGDGLVGRCWRWFDFGLRRIPIQGRRVQVALVGRGLLVPVDDREEGVVALQRVGKCQRIVEIIQGIKASGDAREGRRRRRRRHRRRWVERTLGCHDEARLS